MKICVREENSREIWTDIARLYINQHKTNGFKMHMNSMRQLKLYIAELNSNINWNDQSQ